MMGVDQEASRLNALHKLDLLNSPPDPGLDDLVALVAEICETPISAISLVYADRQWFKASQGLSVSETPRDVAFCSHTIEGRDFFIVEDASQDPRFVSNPLVTNSPGIRFYAGFPLVLDEGEAIGSLCVIDTRPRKLNGLQAKAIAIAGQLVTRILVKDFQEKQRQAIEREVDQQRLAIVGTAKMSALGEMAAGIAHEINNPLAAIMARAGLLIDLAEGEKLNSENVKSAAQGIEVTCIRISKTVRALRAFARDGEGDPLEYTEVTQIIADTLELCHERFRSKGIELRKEVGSPNLKVQCRPVQITQVLLNLLNNAFDAVSELPSDKWVALSAQARNGQCVFSVANGGPPIAVEVRGRIMQPFFTTKPAGQGTGLGLSISQRILHSHESSLKLDSDSESTCFSFELAVRTDEIKNAAGAP